MVFFLAPQDFSPPFLAPYAGLSTTAFNGPNWFDFRAAPFYPRSRTNHRSLDPCFPNMDDVGNEDL